MIILHGKYHFGLRKIGARKDFCNACESESLTELWRSFDCGHIFWIPLLPLGSRERWLCTLCHKDPRARYKTGRMVQIAGLFVTAIFLAAMFIADWKPDEVRFMWGARAFFALALLGFLYSVFKRDPTVTEDERRNAVVPLSPDTCLYCHSTLATQPYIHCPTCQVRIYT
ncbi:MAG: hypothetical protein ACXWKG_13760 [Limisphaerales bacterium]